VIIVDLGLGNEMTYFGPSSIMYAIFVCKLITKSQGAKFNQR